MIDRSGVLGVVHFLLLATMRRLLGLPLRVLVGQLIVAALPGSNFVDIHVVKFLEGATFALDHKEVNNEDTSEQAAGEDVTVGEIDRAGDERRKERDEEVPRPVRGGRQGHALGAILGREQLGNNGPDHRAPRHSISGDEEAGHNNHAFAYTGCVLGIVDVERKMTQRSENHEHDKHPRCTDHERLAPTKVLDNVESSEGCAEINSA